MIVDDDIVMLYCLSQLTILCDVNN